MYVDVAVGEGTLRRDIKFIKQVIGGIFIGACVGCQTVEQARDVEVQRQNERAYYQEIIFRLEGRLENLELQQEAFRSEISSLSRAIVPPQRSGMRFD